MIALVASYSLSVDDDRDVALDTEAAAVIAPSPRPTEASTTTTEVADDETDVADRANVRTRGADAGRTVNYALSLDDVGDGSNAADAAPASPTTQQTTTTTTEPPPQTTVIDQSGSSTSVVADDATTTETSTDAGDITETSAPDTTDSSAPEETTTTAAPTGHPEGFVDAGHGVFVPPILIEIRRCESTHNYQAANPSSTARGAYQFLRSSWAAYGHADRYGVAEAHLATNAQQDEAALITWQRDGTRPWAASRSCWG